MDEWLRLNLTKEDSPVGSMIYQVSNVDTLRAWGKLLMNELHSEAVESLKEEGLTMEKMELVHAEEGLLVIGEQEGQGGKPTNLLRPVNLIHRAVLLQTLTPTKLDDVEGQRELIYQIKA